MNEETQSERPENEVETDALDPSAAADQPDGSADSVEPNQPAEPESRDEEMDRLRAEAIASEQRALRAQAEAENARKRIRRDFEDQLKYASLDLVTNILDVRDNLNRALEASQSTADSAGLAEGVAMVAKQLDDTLTKFGVREIPAEGEAFDPNFHEAISQMPGDQPSGIVMHVASAGFQMHDRVVRPSQVVVSSGPAE